MLVGDRLRLKIMLPIVEEGKPRSGIVVTAESSALFVCASADSSLLIPPSKTEASRVVVIYAKGLANKLKEFAYRCHLLYVCLTNTEVATSEKKQSIRRCRPYICKKVRPTGGS